MDRRSFLKGLGLGVVATAGVLVLPHVPERVYSFVRKRPSIWVQERRGAGRAFEVFEIDGRYEIPALSYVQGQTIPGSAIIGNDCWFDHCLIQGKAMIPTGASLTLGGQTQVRGVIEVRGELIVEAYRGMPVIPVATTRESVLKIRHPGRVRV